MIRVNRGAQDVSLYTHSWRPSKAMLDPSQVSFSLSTSFCQLFISSRRFGHLTQMSSGIEVESSAYDTILLIFTKCISKVDGFIRFYWTVSCPLLHVDKFVSFTCGQVQTNPNLPLSKHKVISLFLPRKK